MVALKKNVVKSSRSGVKQLHIFI